MDGFNPLKSGQLFQIGLHAGLQRDLRRQLFQSPKIGSVVSNLNYQVKIGELQVRFQSPKIGSVVSNISLGKEDKDYVLGEFQSPKIGSVVSNWAKMMPL